MVGEGRSNGDRLEFEPMVVLVEELVASASKLDATTLPRDRISAFTDELMAGANADADADGKTHRSGSSSCERQTTPTSCDNDRRCVCLLAFFVRTSS